VSTGPEAVADPLRPGRHGAVVGDQDQGEPVLPPQLLEQGDGITVAVPVTAAVRRER
jgi:hypothetical protein